MSVCFVKEEIASRRLVNSLTRAYTRTRLRRLQFLFVLAKYFRFNDAVRAFGVRNFERAENARVISKIRERWRTWPVGLNFNPSNPNSVQRASATSIWFSQILFGGIRTPNYSTHYARVSPSSILPSPYWYE